MSTPTNRTEIADVAGPVHTGSGDQIHHYYQLLGQVREDPVPATRRPVTADDLHWLRSRFEPPPGFDRAVPVADGGLVVVSGRAGSGRETAARMLLCPEGDVVREIQEVETEAGIDVPLGDVETGDRLLVNFSALHRWEFSAREGELRSLADTVVRNRARLALVIGREQEDWLHDDLRRRVVRLERPDALRVVLKHLAQAGIQLRAEQVDGPLQEVLEGASMSELMRVGQLVVEESEQDQGGPRGWLAAAVEAIRGYPGELERLLEKQPEGRQRALLLAAAAMAEARIDAVASAERRLLELVEFPAAEQHWLESDGVVARLGRIGAEVDDRRVVFARIGYAEAVLGRLWDEYAGLHQDLGRWLSEVAVSPDLTGTERGLIGDRLGDQLLRSHHVRALLATARAWATQPRNEVRVLAYRLLARAVVDRHCGREARKQLREWALDPSLPARLAHVVLAVCEQVLVHTQPDMAVVRLRLLTLHPAPAVSATAREVLIRLASDGRMYRRILAVLARTNKIDHDLFAVLCAPGRADGNRWTHARLSDCWRAILDERDARGWSHLAEPWLAEAAFGGRPELLDILTAAAGADPVRASRLFVVVREWASRHEGGMPVLTRLRRGLDEQQGVTDLWDDEPISEAK